MSYAQLFNPKLKKRVEEIKKLKIDPGSVSGACLWPLRRTGHLLPEPTRLFCICLFSQGQVGRHIAGLFGAPSPSPTAGRSQPRVNPKLKVESLRRTGHLLPEPTHLICIFLLLQGQVGRHIAGLFGAPSPSPTAGRSQRLPQSVQEEEGLSGSGQVHYCLYLSVYLYIYRFTDIQIDGYR